MTGTARVRRKRRLATNELQSLASDSLAGRKVTLASSSASGPPKVARCNAIAGLAGAHAPCVGSCRNTEVR